MSELKYCIFVLCVSFVVSLDVCPKQCDCDMDNGLYRAICSDQNIINVGVGVPKEVQVYSLSHNAISELDNYCFKELGYISVQELTLSYNLIFWIGLHAFAGLDKLRHLDLSNNRLRYLSSDLFWDTPHLEILDLSANVFESLKNEPFLMHDKLQVLNLNNCRIKALPERLFTRLPNLEKLDLSENYMVTINIETLRPMRKLTRIELRNEYLQCNPDFIAVESWLASHLTYKKQCQKKLPKMSEKMIAMEGPPKADIEITKVWNVTSVENATIPVEPTKTLTPLEKLDKEFSAVQAFIIGLEVGLAIGIVGTYVWLSRFCHCGQLNCTRPPTRRRQRRRVRRTGDGEMRANLLWSSVINPDLATPPVLRRELSLPDRSRPFPVYGLPGAGGAALQADAVRVAPDDRSETPPPPYHECRVNIQ